MAQIKIYGLEKNIDKNREKLSEVIHSAVVEAFDFPVDKRFHRFIGLKKEDFYYPTDRSENYIIIEVSIFEGRSIEAKKKLIGLLFSKIENEIGIRKEDVEITIFETSKCNWGIRGLPGDELKLNYKVEV